MPGKNKDIKSWYVKISETYKVHPDGHMAPKKNNEAQRSKA
jgi:hypothetical protein